MNDSTQQFVIRMVTGVLCLSFLGLVTLFGFSVYTGDTVIPEAFQVQFWNIATTIIMLAGGSLIIFFNSRNALLTRQNSDQNAFQTQEAVNEVKHVVENGLANKISETVKTDAQAVARQLAESMHGTRRQTDVDQTAQQLAAVHSLQAELHHKVDLLLLAASPVGASSPPTVVVVPSGTPVVPIAASPESVQAHTEAVENDTQAMQAHTDELTS